MSAYSTDLTVASGNTGMSLDERVRYAKHLAQAGLLPKEYRQQPANVLLAMETGDMLGIAPMAAITNINVIEGTPSLSAGLMSALVRKAGHKLRVQGGAENAVATITRSDDPEYEYRSEWTLQRAADAGLVQLKNGKPFARSKKGEPLPWEKYPAALLKARAISEVCRDACTDVFMGPIYVPEELGATVAADGTPTQSHNAPADLEGEVVTTSADGTDWDAALKAAEGDVNALRELHTAANRAGVLNETFAAAIVAAGERALAAAREQGGPLGQSVTDEPDDTDTTVDEDALAEFVADKHAHENDTDGEGQDGDAPYDLGAATSGGEQ